MKKITVMIVDDEKLAIEDLRDIVDWDANGFEIVATAVNGKQALIRYRELHPQVILTDIRMPFMDGIEFISRLRELDSKVKVIMLTAYKDFSYAQSAIQYGVTDYLIKSEINNASVTALLQKLRGLIRSEDKAALMLSQKRIADFFSSDVSERESGDMELFGKPFYYIIAEQDFPLNISGYDFLSHEEGSLNRVISLVGSREESDFVIAAASGIRYDRVLIVVDGRETSQKRVMEILRKLAKEILSQLGHDLGCSFTLYTVGAKLCLSGLKDLYARSADNFHSKYFLGVGKVYDLTQTMPAACHSDVVIDEKILESLIDQNDSEGICTYISELFDRIEMDYHGLCRISRLLYDSLRKQSELLPAHVARQDLSADANRCRWLDAAALRQWFCDSFLDIAGKRKTVREDSYSKPISKAMSFIRENYRRSDLNINQIAEAVHLSVGHLCALFKKETAMTLNDYLTDVRISEAKKLLGEGRLKIYEISSFVGYQTSQYFSQVFFKKEGIFPTEFQKGTGREEKFPASGEGKDG